MDVATNMFHFTDISTTLQHLSQMLTRARTQQDVNDIQAEIQRLLSQQQQASWPFLAEGNRK